MTTAVTKTDIASAAECIKRGGLVAVPTETVYGLSADAFNETAVRRIYEVKGRPEEKPINLLVRSMADVEKVCVNIPEEAYKMAEAFWPGPLTMILKKNPRVPDIVTAGLSTVGVRAPDHALTLSLIKQCGVPLATPSANFSGMASACTVKEVLDYFDGNIEFVIDGGECRIGVASTIVDLSTDKPKILRQGGLAREEIEKIITLY